MNNLSKQPHRLGVIAVSVLMILALFMPSLSIMGKLTGSFYDVTVAFVRAEKPMALFAFLIMLISPVWISIAVLTNPKHRTGRGAYVPAGGLLLFMLVLNAAFPKSEYYDSSGLMEYKVGFYAYLFASIVLVVIALTWPKAADQKNDSRDGSTLDSVKTWMVSDQPLRFLPLDFMNTFEKQHFSQLCGDTPVSAKTARFALVIGAAMTYLVLLVLARFEFDLIYGLIFAVVAVVGMACVFLLPVFKGSYTTIDKVLYSLFIIMTAIVCAILGAVFNFVVLIYVVLFLFLNALRQHFAKERENKPINNNNN